MSNQPPYQNCDPSINVPSTELVPAGVSKRPKFLGFVADAESAAVLHSAIDPALPQGGGMHVVDFRTTLNILSRMVTPEVLLVDLTGEDQPLNALMSLAETVEPGTTVLLVGGQRELSFYRAVVNGMGVAEYLAKPLTKAAVEQHFLPYIRGGADGGNPHRNGRLIAVTGPRGGTGTSTVAANLAWLVGHDLHRHALLLDSDLHTGTAALCLDAERGIGLMTALENPERVDGMLIERLAQPITDRVHLISGLEPLGRDISYSTAGGTSLIHLLRRRYKYVIADAGAKLRPFARDLLQMAHQRVMVLDPTILSIRNLERLNQLPGQDSQSPRTLLVLNQAGRPGGLNRDYMERTLGVKFDAVIPDLPRVVPKAEKYGDIAASIRGPFRNGIMDLARALSIEASVESVKTRAAA
jgi:pilus assembly protein CpaE